MHRTCRSIFCFCLAVMLILTVGPVSPAPTVTAHKWEDHTRPFTTRLTGITRQDPGVVLLTLPASVVAAQQVTLIVSTAAYGGHAPYSTRVVLLVNDNPLPALVMGPGLKVGLEHKHLRPGVNVLRFIGVNDTNRIDVYDMRIELTAAPPAREAATPPASTKTGEAAQPPAPERAKAAERPTETPAVPRVDPRPSASAAAPVPAQPSAPAVAKAEEPPPPVAIAPPSAPARDEAPKPSPAPSMPAQPERDPGQRWAVVVGVSDYEDSRIPSLRYAARDAQVFHDWLVAPTGGRYAPSKVKLLLNRNATNEKIKDALFNWLKQAIEEDVVVIYFAGHGSPESPDAVQNLFLLPYNARYDNIAVTGFPMWDVETALKRFIKAKRVVIIADACHAAGVGQGFDVAVRADRGLQINQISSGIQGLTDVGEGVCVISASRDREFSQEGREWGGGHGVFSYFLLEGLKGAADFDRSGSVSVGEVTVYVSQQVRRATRNAQNPIVAGRFDPSLVIGK
jgi:hypothetical protein